MASTAREDRATTEERTFFRGGGGGGLYRQSSFTERSRSRRAESLSRTNSFSRSVRYETD